MSGLLRTFADAFTAAYAPGPAPTAPDPCPPDLTDDQRAEWLKCRDDPAYFFDTYGQVYDATSSAWLPFKLWPDQRRVLADANSPGPAWLLFVILKARQLGLTWLCIGWLLWLCLFRPNSTVLLFSRRDDEAMDLLTRMTGMHGRLPEWLRDKSLKANAHEWKLSNGSRGLAFPTGVGDSYTATAVLLDEADLMPDLDKQLRAVKPTVDAGGKLILLSRSDKSKPQSPFKRVFRAAVESNGRTGWRPIFLPWHARPGRTPEWYERLRAEILARTGSLDELHEQYPATPEEALSARSLDKRLPPQWIAQCYQPMPPLDLSGPSLHHLESDAPSLPQLKVFKLPEVGRSYVVSLDPAEGLPNSDDSALDVLDRDTGEQCATLAAKLTPAVLASVAANVSRWFNNAGVLPERNSHGVGVIQWFADFAPGVFVLRGPDGRPGWQTNSSTKAILYDGAAEVLKDRRTLIHDPGTQAQLAAVELSTLSAPEGEHDDKAVAYALALKARDLAPRGQLEVW